MSKVLSSKPETEIKIEILHALNVCPAMLEDIKNWVDGSFDLYIRGICEDNAIRNFTTFEALTDYRNSPDGDLCALEFSMKDSKGNRISAEISNQLHFRPKSAYFRVGGDDNFCIKLRSNIRSDMKSYRPWYSPLARMTIETFIVAYFVLGLPYHVFRMLEVDTANLPPLNSYMITPAVGFIMLAVWLIIKLGNILKKYVFPSVTFSIGHGEVRNENREWIRRLVVGVIVSFVLFGLNPTWHLRGQGIFN